jgi:hypothetical protein
MLEVYFGLALLERVERGKDSFQFKLLVGRLYNMNYRRRALVEAFDVDLKTIRKWGGALKSGQIDMIEAAFGGHEIRRKLTPEVESYARSRFKEIYQDNRYDYSRIIRSEIKEHFQKTLCAETLRPVFKDEKMQMAPPVQPAENAPCREIVCDSGQDLSSNDEETRNQIPSKPHEEKAVFLHHAGILLLLHLISRVTEGLPLRQLSCQWIISVLLGAVNIERSGRLDFASLSKLAGMEFLTSPRHQRIALKTGSTEYNRMLLFRRNSDFINADGHRWYYYDPHGIRYTGMRRILKGWCGSVGKITKAHYQDFIHTSSGEPVFFKSFDNYYDLRERFPTTVAEFAQTLKNPLRNLVFVIDRGIYGHDVLAEIHRRGDTIVTWEKGYGHDGWDEKLPVLHFRIMRYRNSLQDTTSCEFDCVRYPFCKIPGYDRIIVRARRDGKEDIEVSVLVNGDELTTEEAVTAIFSRWIQEGDFLYEVRHFGLNQITSYDFEDYGSLEECLIEKAVESNGYIVQKIRRGKLDGELRRLLHRREDSADRGKDLNAKDMARIGALKDELKEIAESMRWTEKKCRKEDKLVEEGAQKLNTVPKQYMDIVKITARNIFFKLFGSFRPTYNNFRNDHAILRELTRAPGFVFCKDGKTMVFLHPALTIQPKVREKLQLFLDQTSDAIEKSGGGNIEFKLWDKDIAEAKRGIFICDC